MLFSQTFGFNLIRSYTVLFGSLFDNIVIKRTDANTTPLSEFRVPITFAPKEKVIARLHGDPKLDRPTAIELPVMSFELMDITYAPSRKLSTTRKIVYKDPNNGYKDIYNPVAYDFHYNLYVYSKYMDDGTKIIEQILPFFVPDYVPTIHLIPEMNIVADIPIVIGNVSHQELYEGDFIDKRVSFWTLSFVIKGFLYGPIRASGIIKFVNVNFNDYYSNNLMAAVQVYPGLTSNGQPTTNPNNAIDYNLVNANDNFSYITIIKE